MLQLNFTANNESSNAPMNRQKDNGATTTPTGHPAEERPYPPTPSLLMDHHNYYLLLIVTLREWDVTGNGTNATAGEPKGVRVDRLSTRVQCDQSLLHVLLFALTLITIRQDTHVRAYGGPVIVIKGGKTNLLIRGLFIGGTVTMSTADRQQVLCFCNSKEFLSITISSRYSNELLG